jgi:pimeloyl-ACP methyl ester carboxylesterase
LLRDISGYFSSYLNYLGLLDETNSIPCRWFFTLVVYPVSSIAQVTGVEHWVENGPIKLYVWEKFSGSKSANKVLILAHGSGTAGKESFDLQVPGFPDMSLMDVLAQQGFDVFALDTRGFGRSTHPEGHITTAEASQDLKAVVDYVTKLRGMEKVDLLGWSWGTQYAGMYLMENTGKINKYISLAQMHINSPDLAKRRPRLDFFRKNPYITIPEAGWKPRFTSIAPDSVNYTEAIDTFARAAMKVETRSPTGPQLDMVTMMPMVNPRLITVPTMIIYGEYDDVADINGLMPFFSELPNMDKRHIVVPDAGHMIQFQKGRHYLHGAIVDFLSDEKI